jgi:hypothetical protein
MTSKVTQVTLSFDELTRMKMKANLIPNCTYFVYYKFIIDD